MQLKRGLLAKKSPPKKTKNKIVTINTKYNYFNNRIKILLSYIYVVGPFKVKSYVTVHNLGSVSFKA